MLTGKQKAKWQRGYMKLWRRADTLARRRALTHFPPLKSLTQLDTLLGQGALPKVAEYIKIERKRILQAARMLKATRAV